MSFVLGSNLREKRMLWIWFEEEGLESFDRGDVNFFQHRDEKVEGSGFFSNMRLHLDLGI